MKPADSLCSTIGELSIDEAYEVQAMSVADRPTMPKEVAPADLVVPSNLDLSGYEPWPSGGSAYFDAVGKFVAEAMKR